METWAADAIRKQLNRRAINVISETVPAENIATATGEKKAPKKGALFIVEEYITNQQKLLCLMETACGQAGEIHAAGKFRSVKYHLISPGGIEPIRKSRHFPPLNIIYYQ